MGNKPFSVATRAADLVVAAAAELDVLVVGMGATGAGVALDAASRGLRVAVLDKGDLASGTSSKSSKLVHGGLRYLENYEFGLVREGVVERQLLMRLAPHLVRPMDFLYPVWPDTAKRRLLGLGLTTYDVFAFASLGPRGGDLRRHERIDAAAAIAAAPALVDSDVAYAYRYGDCATDDARLVLAVVQAARRFGALTVPYAEVIGLLKGGDGRVTGATVRDRVGGGTVEIRARHVVNATGVWVDHLQGLEDPGRPAVVQPSKGVHVVVPRERLPLLDASILLPSKQGDARSMFAIPWGRQTILGTTDTPYDGSLDELSLTAADLEYVLAAGNAVFHRDLRADDVLGAWAGVRPLIKENAGGSMSDISRRHTLVEGSGGLLTITGGKLTTYRRMAKDVVDRIVDRDGRRARCRTDEISLTGTRSYGELLAETSAATAALGLEPDVAAVLVRQSGEAASDVLSLVAADPSLGRTLSPSAPHLAAEVVQAARSEGAVTLDDVFSRRFRLSLRAKDAGLPAAPLAARLLAAETGRDEQWADAQVAAYADAVRRERGVLGLPDSPLAQAV
ncbi:MAG: glycerol-3-phosphate dehydrogenase/oxidase [Frankiales bacterium]|nr:glycerol-3-phosphate dehydrogenase/oxidase [Frankiales bacterium]